MEGLFRLLLVAGLLAAVLPAAAATFGPQPGAPCEPTLLATQVALFCAPDMPTAQCCEPVVAAVDLGGGVPCLCRVAAEPQLVMAGLNATHLLTLYTSCGGLRPGGAHLAAACEGPAPSAAVVSAPPPSPGPRRKHPAHEAPPPPPSTEKPSPPPQQHDGAAHSKAVPAYAVLPAAAAATFRPQPVALCQPTSIATQVALFCTPDTPTAQCCEPVVAAMDLGGGVPCLCRVAAEPQLIMAGLNATHLLTLYTSCGGLRPGGAHLAAACEGNAPPAAVISALPPLPPSAGPRRKQLPSGVSVRLSIAQKHMPCDFPGLASYIDDNCGETAPNASCCMAVVAAVDIKNCFCRVIMEEPMLTGPIGGRHIIFLYNACGGIRALSDEEVLACDSPAKAYSTPISQESSLAVGIETNDTSLQKDIYYVTKLNTVLLAAVAILFSMQACLLCFMYFKAMRVGRRDTSTRNNGGQPHYQYEQHRTKGDPRLVQSDGGRGSFSSLGMLTPYSRLDHRAD